MIVANFFVPASTKSETVTRAVVRAPPWRRYSSQCRHAPTCGLCLHVERIDDGRAPRLDTGPRRLRRGDAEPVEVGVLHGARGPIIRSLYRPAPAAWATW